jgi:hypothetical protein
MHSSDLTARATAGSQQLPPSLVPPPVPPPWVPAVFGMAVAGVAKLISMYIRAALGCMVVVATLWALDPGQVPIETAADARHAIRACWLSLSVPVTLVMLYASCLAKPDAVAGRLAELRIIVNATIRARQRWGLPSPHTAHLRFVYVAVTGLLAGLGGWFASAEMTKLVSLAPKLAGAAEGVVASSPLMLTVHLLVTAACVASVGLLAAVIALPWIAPSTFRGLASDMAGETSASHHGQQHELVRIAPEAGPTP